MLVQAEAARGGQFQVHDLQEQLRTQRSMTDEAVEARREGETSMAALSKQIRERDALLASAKVSPHNARANLCSCFAPASKAIKHALLMPSTLHSVCQLLTATLACMACSTRDIHLS